MTPEDWLYLLIGLAFLTGWVAAWSVITILDGLLHVDGPDPMAHDRTTGDGNGVVFGMEIDTPQGRERTRRRLGVG